MPVTPAAVVTGASASVGRAIARAFAALVRSSIRAAVPSDEPRGQATVVANELAGMNVNVWDVTDVIANLVRSRVQVDEAKLADVTVPLGDLASAAGTATP